MKAILISSIGIIVGIVAMTAAMFVVAPYLVQGSVTQGNEYTSTTTVSTSAGTMWQAKSTSGNPYCALGAITVSSSSATTLTLWDATSTTDVSSTTIATLKAGISEGTYTYDIYCKRGLVISTPTGFNGNYTVTWR